MIYTELDACFVTPPPSFTLCSKRSLRQKLFLSLKCYFDWHLGAIHNDLTTLKLRITEDSAKLLVNSLQSTVIYIIGLIEYGNIFYVSPAHSAILKLEMEYLLGGKLL